MTLPSLSLQGKVAIVTGARRGIGRAIALTFAEAGANVAICDCVVEGGELANVAREIQRFGRRSLAVQTDVRIKSQVDNFVQRVVDEFRVIDILVNNAGIYSLTRALETPEDEWDSVIDTNLKGYSLCTQAVGKRMEERGSGNIISIASVAGTGSLGLAGGNVYYMSKAGVILLTKVLARELGKNIRVNAIAPGVIRTDMTRFIWEDPKALEPFLPMIPMGRIGEPNEIASAALFLASDASSYVNGHILVVDGGWLS